MPITFTCPDCQCKMSVPDALAGKRGKCSKCKATVTVPGGSNGASAKPAGAARSNPPTPKGPTRSVSTAKPAAPPPAAPPAPRAEKKPPAKVEAPPRPPEDLEAAALAALADEPVAEEKKVSTVIEFDCPMCFEPLKLPVELGGKKHPCEHCKRIITVPMPKAEQRTNWRDTGPKLPSAARRDEGPAPEGAWDTTKTTGVNIQGLKEEGILEGKRKPLTFLQKARPYILIGGPLLILLFGGLFLYGWMARNKEKNALEEAVRFAEDSKKSASVGSEGVAALEGDIALYHARSDRTGCAPLALKHLNKAIALASAVAKAKSPLGDALLLDFIPIALALGADDKELEGEKHLNWNETQKALRNILAGMNDPEARLEGLRRTVVGLAERGQTSRTLVLVAQVYGNAGADRSEALAIAGLELFRLGKKGDAAKAAEQAESPYADKKNRPALRSSVVALAIALEKKDSPAKPLKDNRTEKDAFDIGTAEGLVRRGELAKARTIKPVFKDSQFRAQVTVASIAAESKQTDLDDFTWTDRTVAAAHPWEVLRLLEAGIRAGAPAERLELLTAILDEPYSAWGRLLLLRGRLAHSTAQEAPTLEKLSPASLPGRVALLEVSRHNTRLGGSAQSDIQDEAAKAFTALGVALGLQKGK
jgi:hypothetical protein